MSLLLVSTSSFCMDLGSIKQNLILAKQKVAEATQQIRDTYTDIQTNVVNKLEMAVGDVDKQADSLKSTIETLDGIPAKNLVLGVANIADLYPALKWMLDNPVAVIKRTLSGIEAGFAGVNAHLNPQTDPKGVYANFDASIKNFDDALKKLDELMAAIKAF